VSISRAVGSATVSSTAVIVAPTGYSAIALARVDSPEAVAEADKLAPKLKPLGFVVGPAPSGVAPATPPAKAKAKGKEKDDKAAKKKKK